MKSQIPNPNYNYSCAPCAEKAGAKSDGSVHTVSFGTCEICCKKDVPVFHRGDWIWPGEKKTVGQWD